MKKFTCFLLAFTLMAANCTSADSSYSIEKPLTEGYLKVSGKHEIFYATYGNPNGIPVLVVHGGPGLGSNDGFTQFFDLNRWHVVMFDQRGAMRSRPLACMEENTPQHSIEDMELLRKHLGIDKWVLFGHSWGSCLSLLYGEAHSKSCLSFILSGVFLGRAQDIRFFKDFGKECPLAFQEFLRSIPQEEQTDLQNACYRKVMDQNPEVHLSIARSLMRFQLQCSKEPPSEKIIEAVLQEDRFILSFIRAFLHYVQNGCFLEPDQVLKNIKSMSHLPAMIVHGTEDRGCFPEQAELLHQNWTIPRLVD